MTATLYKKSPEIHILPTSEGYAVYHHRLGGLCIINSKAFQLLNSFETPSALTTIGLQTKNDTEAQVIQHFISRHFLVPELSPNTRNASAPKNNFSDTINNIGIKVLQLVMINACNFNCSYCFEGAKLYNHGIANFSLADKKHEKVKTRGFKKEVTVNRENSVYASEQRFANQYDPQNIIMRPKSAIRYVQCGINLALRNSSKKLMIQFFGGEPLLNWKSIRAVIKTFGRGETKGIELEYSIVTNGSLISEQIAQLSLKNPATCQGCEIETFCSGFCIGPIEKMYGTIDKVETRTCSIYKGITRELIAGLRSSEVIKLSL